MLLVTRRFEGFFRSKFDVIKNLESEQFKSEKKPLENT